MKPHYHVIWDAPGAPAPAHPRPFKTRKEAGRYLDDILRFMRCAGYKVSGSARDGYYTVVPRQGIHTVSVTSCRDAECLLRRCQR